VLITGVGSGDRAFFISLITLQGKGHSLLLIDLNLRAYFRSILQKMKKTSFFKRTSPKAGSVVGSKHCTIL